MPGYGKPDLKARYKRSSPRQLNGAQRALPRICAQHNLIRRIVKNEALVTEFKIISKTNNIIAALLYMEDITNKKIVDDYRRVDSLNIDYISGSGMLEQLIEDKS